MAAAKNKKSYSVLKDFLFFAADLLCLCHGAILKSFTQSLETFLKLHDDSTF